jgi:lipopolysaccharide O-acetyltransferase
MFRKISNYHIYSFLNLIISFAYTKVFHFRSRLIRLPVDLRGVKYIDFGKNLTTGKNCRIEAYDFNKRKEKLIIFGNNIQINDMVHIAARKKIIIEDNVLMASRIFITDHNHGSFDGYDDLNINYIDKKAVCKDVLIKKNVWIGENCNILPGVTIGEFSVIGAGSTVTKSIPAYSIAVGSPAVVVKFYNKNEKKWKKI